MSRDEEQPEVPRITSHQLGWAKQALLSAAILGVIATFTYCVVEKTYLWPFSPHPMYSRLQGRSFGTTLTFGVSPVGEFRFKSKHVKPFTNSMIRAAVGGARGKRQKKLLRLFREVYTERRPYYPNDPEFPEHLLGLRVYSSSWRLRDDASNRDKPRRRLISEQLFLPREMQKALAAEAKGSSSKISPVEVPARDIVIDVGSVAQQQQHPALFPDPHAGGGLAWLTKGKSRKRPRQTPDQFIDIEFEAEKGRYYVWLRGKTQRKKHKNGSVWLQLNKHIGTKKIDSWQKKAGLGNWRSAYPANAFGWASKKPGSKPGRWTIDRSGKQRLRISPRHGQVVIDQVWLSKSQNELPLHTAAMSSQQESVQ